MGTFKRPESVLVVVYTTAGAVMLMERTRPHGYWQSVTGSLKWDETPLQAAQRELKEETGLSPDHLRDLQQSVGFRIRGPWRRRYRPDEHWNLEHWFALELANTRMICLNPGEHRQYRWFDLQQASHRVSSQSNRDCIQQIFSV